MEIPVNIEPHLLFRYPSEWDPRDDGKTKGGYLEGSLQLPKDRKDLKLILSTHPDSSSEESIYKTYPEYSHIHPTILHLIRKGVGGKRAREKEPTSNIHQWQLELHIKGGFVYVRNITTQKDEARYEEGNKIDRIPDEDRLFKMKEDYQINFGKTLMI